MDRCQLGAPIFADIDTGHRYRHHSAVSGIGLASMLMRPKNDDIYCQLFMVGMAGHGAQSFNTFLVAAASGALQNEEATSADYGKLCNCSGRGHAKVPHLAHARGTRS